MLFYRYKNQSYGVDILKSSHGGKHKQKRDKKKNLEPFSSHNYGKKTIKKTHFSLKEKVIASILIDIHNKKKLEIRKTAVLNLKFYLIMKLK